MIPSSLMVSTSSITMQSLGEINQRTPDVGAKIWCFLCVTLGLPARRGHSLNKCYVTVYGSILMLFSPFFRKMR